MSDTETNEDQKLARKAYGNAMAELRDGHREEFDALLDKHYDALEVVRKRRASQEEAAAKRAAKEAEKIAKREARRLKRLAALEAEIAILKAESEDERVPEEVPF